MGFRQSSQHPPSQMGWTLGAIGGALLAGSAITAMMMHEEQQTGAASELTKLSRASARQVGPSAPPDKQKPGTAEQTAVQGGHLVLSALAGGAYAASFDEDLGLLTSGIGFGLAFYVMAHVVAGPMLGIKAPEWRQPSGTLAKHTAIHVAFGLITALGARLGVSLSAKT